MTGPPSFIFLCNGADAPDGTRGQACIRLDYRRDLHDRNLEVSLPDFWSRVHHLPDRLLDLLETAAYVQAGDRLAPRGSRELVEF